MQAQLTDGHIVDLAKDCLCNGIHDGPHWIHADDLERQMNHDILRNAKQIDHVLIHRVAELEIARLEAKRRTMERLHIERIIRDEQPEATV